MHPFRRPRSLVGLICAVLVFAASPFTHGQTFSGWATGSGHAGQLGSGVPTNFSAPLTLATGVATAAVGSAHTVWVKTDGTLWAIGGNTDGQLGTGDTADRAAAVQIPSAVSVTAVAAGRAHTLLLKTDATLWAVGNNAYGQLGLGDTTDRHTPVQIATGVVSIAAGDDHTLFVKIDGSLWTCGRNTHGQLGDGSTTDRATPASIIATGVTRASGGAAHSLFIKTDATLWATGQSAYGQLGTGATNSVPQTTPVQVATGALRASAGANHSLLVKTDGSVHATGDNFFGQFGNGTQSRSYSFAPIGSGRSAVAAGLLHSLFITNTGSLLGSGDNRVHQLGGSSGVPVMTAQTLATGISAVFTRDLHSVWLTTDGTLLGLGDNRAGQLGTPASTTASPLSLGPDITAISQGVAHTLYLKTDGSLWAVGDNTYGQLGLGDTLPRTAPVQIATGVASVSAGSFHTLFVKTDGTLWATGRNDRGQLGNNSTTDRTTAVQITTGVRYISAGASHSLFTKTDEVLWGMGDNSYSQINPNGSSFSPVTQAIQVATGVTAFSAGGAHSLYVSGGNLYALGNNSFGQLGTGTTFLTPPIGQRPPITNGVTAVSTAYAHTLFLKTDGTLWGMGANSSGQLGLGDTTARLSPVQIATDGASFAAGGLGRGLGTGHSFFAKRDGTLWSMGDNRFGQLGDGNRLDRLIPVQVSGASHVIAVAAGDLTGAFIQAPPAAPAITASPLSQEIENGGYARLQVSASGGFLSHQWFLGAVGDTSRPVAGATSAHLLTLPVVEPLSFWLRVTNEIGSIDSSAATVTPRARPVAALSGAGALGYGAFGESSAATRVGIPIPLSADFAALAHGSSHTLILKQDGTLWALGSNGSGQLGTGDTTHRASPVQVASSVASCAVGSAHSLFLKTDGTLWGMGDNSRGQLGDGTTTRRSAPVQISASVRAFAVGSSHTLFVKTDDTVWACGLNTSGQLGDGTATNRTTPIQIASAVASIAAGSFHSLFLKIDNTLWATGANSVGQLGDGTATNRSTPALVATGVAACSANSSGTHSLFITTDGSLFGMGENASGRLGLGDTVDRTTPTLIDTRVASCSAGADHSLWIKTDQSLWGAGNGDFGQLGLGVASAQVLPREIAAGVSQAVASVRSSHFFDPTGVLRGMGRNHLGQLFAAPSAFLSPIQLAANVAAIDTVFAGQPESRRLGSDGQIWGSFGPPGDADPSPGLAATGAVRLIASPIFKQNGLGIESASGPDRLLFLRADGSLWGAGDNSTGALGTGDTLTPTAPVQIATGVADAAAAGHGTTFLKTNGTLWVTGQLRSASGGGLHSFGLSPVQIDTDVRAIASSHGHLLYLKTDDSIWGLGDSIYRQLGVVAPFGSMISSPVRIAGDVVRFAAGQRHTLLIKRDGTLWVCGLPSFGQLGLTSNAQGLPLTQVTTGVADVVTTAEASFIIKTDGTVWATGRNGSGQLGTGNTTDTSTFTQLFSSPGPPPQPLTGVAKIIPSLSGEATFFLKTDGTLLGMGRNDRGQLGLGHTNVVNRPTLLRAQAYAVAASGLHTLFLHEPAPLSPPAIVAQPVALTVPFASFATLSVGASGGELLTYQWYQGASGDTSRPVTGATDSTLRLPAFAGTATYWARVTNVAGTADTAAANVTVTGSGTPAFRAWAETAGLSGSRLSVTADADNDDLANLLEYAFATAPDAPGDRGPPEPAFVRTADGDFLVLTHRRLKDASLAFVYETSTDLSSWAPESLIPTVLDPDADNDGRVEEVAVALRLSPATPPRFLRVRVSTP